MLDLALTPTPRLDVPGPVAPPAATGRASLEARPVEAVSPGSRDGTTGEASRASAGREDRLMRRIMGFSTASLGFIALVVLIVWAMGGLEGGDLGVHGWIALVSGSVLTTALGVALMALAFYSDQSGHDESAAEGRRA